MFDCIPKKPVWKSNEDRQYYLNQKQNLGGYCTLKEIPYYIHPSKRPRRIELPSMCEENVDMADACSDHSEDSTDPNFNSSTTPKVIGDANFAELLRERANLSISQTIAVMQFYKDNFPDVSCIPMPPTRGSLSRASRKASERISADITIEPGTHNLYFDMKQYKDLYGQKREMICVCVDDKLVEFEELPNKKAGTIAQFLLQVVGKWKVDRIVSDTEPTNTGSKNGVFALIRKRYPNIIYEPCRLHVLDLILKHEMQHFLGKSETTSPNIPYNFVTVLQEKWSQYRKKYYETERSPVDNFQDLPKNEHRRDDYRYLLELTKAVRTLKETGERRYIKIPFKPINISSARWNSKAIYCLMAELILENNDEHVLSLNQFIVYQWAPVWFGVRDVADWSKLTNLSESANNVLSKHNLTEKVEYKPPTNEAAERIFRMANEKISRCSSVGTLRNALIRYVNNCSKLN